MMSQLIFVESFVDDLLDLKQMQAGVFTFSAQPFDVKEVF